MILILAKFSIEKKIASRYIQCNHYIFILSSATANVLHRPVPFFSIINPSHILQSFRSCILVHQSCHENLLIGSSELHLKSGCREIFFSKPFVRPGKPLRHFTHPSLRTLRLFFSQTQHLIYSLTMPEKNIWAIPPTASAKQDLSHTKAAYWPHLQCSEVTMLRWMYRDHET